MAAPAQSTLIQFHSGYMARVDDKEDSTWILERDYTSRPTWQQLLDDGMRCYTWLRTDAYSRRYSVKNETCLVATICFDWSEAGIYKVFHSTIPRGKYLDRMWDAGALKARHWWAAISSTPSSGSRNTIFHAEDGAIFLCETTMGDSILDQGREELRMVVCGRKKGTDVPGKAKLCPDSSKKKPNCREIAAMLQIKFLDTGSAADLDEEDEQRLQQQLQQQQLQQQQQQQQQPPSSSGSGSHYSGGSFFDGGYVDPTTNKFVPGDGASNERTRRTNPGQGSQSHRSGASSDSFSQITQGMSRLNMGGGGGSGNRRPRGAQNGGPVAQSGGFQILSSRGPGPQSASRSEARPQPPRSTPRQSSAQPMGRPSSSAQTTGRAPRMPAGRDTGRR